MCVGLARKNLLCLLQGVTLINKLLINGQSVFNVCGSGMVKSVLPVARGNINKLTAHQRPTCFSYIDLARNINIFWLDMAYADGQCHGELPER